MNDQQLLRYSRQIMLPNFGIEGQQQLLDSRVLIIGAGGLGSPIAMYLAAAGVGKLVLVDDDVVDMSNLQRQIVHSTSSVGQSKVDSAKQTLLALNPACQVITYAERLQGKTFLHEVELADVVIDATDNFDTRFLLNQLCVEAQTPLVSGAAIRMEGQVSVFRNDQPDSPCYRCLYKDEDEPPQSCSETGVMAPLVGIIGSIQAIEAIKILTSYGDDLSGRLLILDALTMEWRTLRLKKDSACPICNNR